MLKFFVRIVTDLIQLRLPWRQEKNGYAFIVHPRNYHDVVNNVPFLKFFPKFVVFKIFPMLWPFTVSKIKGLKSLKDGSEIPGWVIGVPIFARELIERREHSIKKINQAIRLSKNKGAKVVGLSGLTGSVMQGGAGLTQKGGVVVTAGRAYTAYVVNGYLEDVIRRFDLIKPNLVIAILGAAGGVGSALTRLIVNEPYKKLILIDLERKINHIHELFENSVKDHVEITHQINAVKTADVIITVTNAPEAVLESDDLKPGVIVIDDAQPSDIPQAIVDDRQDILVIEAGVITGDPSISIGTNMRLVNKNELYCCLGEVMTLVASEWRGEYKPGEITVEVVQQLSELANKLGFGLAPYQAYGKLVSPSRLEAVKTIIKKNEVT